MAERSDAVTRKSKGRSGPIVVTVLLAIAVGVVALGGYRLQSVRRDAADAVSRATSSLEEADRLVARVDAVVGAQVRSGLETQVAEARTLGEEAKMGLDRAVGDLDEALVGLRGEEATRARLLKEAAESRLEMLELAPSILDGLLKAAVASPSAESAWARVVEADSLSGRAVREYNRLTSSGVRASNRLNKRVEAELKQAREEFLVAESAFPEAGIEAYIAYVDARSALNKLSQRSDSAWLSGDYALANELIDSYNKGDTRAIAQAKKLPSSSASVIAAAYDEVTRDVREKYYTARERATRADARLKGM